MEKPSATLERPPDTVRKPEFGEELLPRAGTDLLHGFRPFGFQCRSPARIKFRADTDRVSEEKNHQVKQVRSERHQILPAPAIIALSVSGNTQGRADLPALYSLLHCPVWCPVTPGMRHAEFDAAFLNDPDNLIRLLQTCGHRFLAVDMAPSLRRHADLRQMVRRTAGGDDHDIRLLAFDHFSRIVIASLRLRKLHDILTHPRIGIRQCGNLDARQTEKCRMESVQPEVRL